MNLWNDKNFCQRRINEQYDYLDDLVDKYEEEKITNDRFMELRDTAIFVLRKFQDRWQYLNEKETIERLSDTANFIG